MDLFQIEQVLFSMDEIFYTQLRSLSKGTVVPLHLPIVIVSSPAKLRDPFAHVVSQINRFERCLTASTTLQDIVTKDGSDADV